MTNKKKDYQEPALDVIKVRRLNLLVGDSHDAEDPDARHQGHDFGD